MSMEMTRCVDCKYWIGPDRGGEIQYGECHCHAPRESGPYQFPRTMPENGCGEGEIIKRGFVKKEAA